MRPQAGIFALALIASACVVPTEAPNWDMTWDLPIPDKGKMNIPLTSFLPAGVTVDNPATRFAASVGSFPNISKTLGFSCSSCTNTTAAKPAFSAPPATSDITLAAGSTLTSATLAAGSQVVFTLTNGYSFDPIRPQPSAAQTAANTGTITITVNNGTTTLGTLTLQGLTTAIPAGSTTPQFTIPLTGNIVSAQPITVIMTMISPAGDVVTMNTASVFTVNPTATLNVSTATVNLPAQALTPTATDLPLSGLDKNIANRVADSTTNQGKLFLEVTSSFTVGVNGTVTFTGTKTEDTPTGTTTVSITPIVKSVVIAAAAPGSSTSTIAIDLTGKELREIIGADLVATITGTTVAGSTVITPASSLLISPRMQVHLYAREF